MGDFVRKISQRPQLADLESMLTRAVQRAMNQGAATENLGIEKVHEARKSSIDSETRQQLRLLAETICKRLERRYDLRLQEQRSRDHAETERRMADIRREYHQNLEQKERELAYERQRLEDSIGERSKTLNHEIRMKFGEQENRLEVSRMVLDGRFTELQLGLETLEKEKRDFKQRMEAELDHIRLEKERLALKDDEMRSIDKAGIGKMSALERAQNTERIHSLEERLQESVARVAALSTETFQYRDKLLEHEAMKVELSVLKERYQRESDKNRTLAADVRRMSDYKAVIDENDRLREEVSVLKHEKETSPAKSEMARKEAAWLATEQAQELKIKELKMIIHMQNERTKSLMSDKAFLQEELREMKKQLYRGDRSKRRESSTLSSDGKAYREIGKGRHASRKFVASSGSSDEVETSSNQSSEEVDREIDKIRRRLKNLDGIARDLDASVEHFNQSKSFTEKLAKDSHTVLNADYGYDDFCRSIGAHSSPMKDSALPRREPEGMTDTRRQEIVDRRERVRRDVQKAAEDVTPSAGDIPTRRRLSYSRMDPIGFDRQSPIEAELPAAGKKENLLQQGAPDLVKESTTPSVGVVVPVNKPTAPTTFGASAAATMSFEERIRASNQQMLRTRGIRASIAEEAENEESATAPPQPEKVPDPPKEEQGGSAVPAGVDPVMAHYMQLVMRKRQEESTTASSLGTSAPSMAATPAAGPSSITPSSVAAQHSKEVEVVLADEIQLDKGQQSDDDFVW